MPLFGHALPEWTPQNIALKAVETLPDLFNQQPTQFWLYTYPPPIVFEASALIASLASYSESLRNPPVAAEPALRGAPEPILKLHAADPSSILFLQIFTAADYFTSNASLMQSVPLLDVDISAFSSPLCVSQSTSVQERRANTTPAE